MKITGKNRREFTKIISRLTNFSFMKYNRIYKSLATIQVLIHKSRKNKELYDDDFHIYGTVSARKHSVSFVKSDQAMY